MKKTKYLLLIILLIAVTFISMPRIVSAADETTSILKVKEIKIDSLSEKEEENKQNLSIYLINVTNNDVTWTSSDETVATVSADGWLTAKKEGTAIITVTVKDKNIKESCTVTITNEGSTGSTNNEEESQTTETWTDTSNIKIKIIKTGNNGDVAGYSITTENITYNKESIYYIYITSGKNKPTYTTQKNNRITDDGYTMIITNGKATQFNNETTKALELNEDIYAWIVESKSFSENGYEYKYENKFILEEYKVERPALNNIGERIRGYFFEDYISLFNWNPTDLKNEDKRKIKIKIGTVNDNAILKSLEKKEAGALNKLLTYAKSAKAVYTDSLKSGKTNLKISDKMKITYKQFYYVYFELDDENGKYYPVEDVMLYQGGLTSLNNYLDGNLKWNFNEENNSTSTPTDTTITPDKKLPQTGEKIAIIGTIGIAVVVAVVLGIKAKKYNF